MVDWADMGLGACWRTEIVNIRENWRRGGAGHGRGGHITSSFNSTIYITSGKQRSNLACLNPPTFFMDVDSAPPVLIVSWDC